MDEPRIMVISLMTGPNSPLEIGIFNDNKDLTCIKVFSYVINPYDIKEEESFVLKQITLFKPKNVIFDSATSYFRMIWIEERLEKLGVAVFTCFLSRLDLVTEGCTIPVPLFHEKEIDLEKVLRLFIKKHRGTNSINPQFFNMNELIE
jgi:hypothetical protein